MVLLVNLARVVFAPLLGEFILFFGVDRATVGIVATLVWLGSAVLRVPTGWLLTRVPRHRVVLGTGVVLVVASGVTASATTVETLMVGAVSMGLASGAYFVAANPLVSELFPDRVGRAMGIHGTASQLAAVGVAPFVTLVLAVGPDLVPRLPFVSAAWQLVFVCVGLAAAVVTLALFVTARSTDLPDAGAADRDLLGAARTEWRVILTGIVILGFTGFVWQGLFNFYELYMVSKGLPATTARNMLTVVFGAGVPAFFLSGRLADNLPRIPYILGVLVSFVVSVFVLTMTTSLVGLVVVTAVVGYVIHSLFPALDAYLLDTLPDESRGSAYSVYSFGMMIFQASGSGAVGTLTDFGYAFDEVFFWFSVGLAVVVTGLIALQRAGRIPN
ncbi:MULTISPECIES: MFS transporter [Haloferax]|uniref:Major Facilitator Superfamily protein n=1 Tax=Haloferax massiliensis TaxID=1476858 RepID=A0A0D6JSD0_9EURY|nr:MULTISPECIES: MFS transporter [Haloferax]MDS0240636.1 MFS transporter [Haloferax sp. S2CR25]MDS0443757.1 MFS transporter [Haloferax sp. S2CR25-2]CQR50759.1 Major Facilitator Superfamily protein [Haloferax massiliensis]